ncbi:MAG TPA: RICIN domain-containing protein [Micromonosporaceae bacterium]|nr:RICIN domain-containing protein [Micromonosporaceae bacterium]
MRLFNDRSASPVAVAESSPAVRRRRGRWLRRVLAAGLVAASVPAVVLAQRSADAAAVDPTAYYAVVAKHSGRALTVGSALDGANVVQQTRADAPSQQWRFVATADGHYKILNRGSGKALDVFGQSLLDGAAITQWTDNSGANQQWRLVDVAGGGVQIVSRHSGKVVDVFDESRLDGAKVTQWSGNGRPNQQWTLTRLGGTGPTAGPGTPPGTVPSAPGAFVHPGIGYNRADLDWLKANLSVEPFKTAYDGLTRDTRSSLSYVMKGPFPDVGRSPDIHLGEYRNDMDAVFNLALMWYFTGNAEYGAKATGIIRAWATTQKEFTGSEPYLSIGDYINRSVGGAEILRGTYPGWTAADTAVVKKYFTDLYWPRFHIGGDRGPLSQVRSANQGAGQIQGAMAVAVFIDDRAKFNQVVDAFLTDPAGGIRNSLPNGQLGDTGRDQGHAYGELKSLAYAAEVAWKQGVDLFAAEDNRLLAASEYFADYNLGGNPPFIQAGTSYGLYTSIGGPRWIPPYNDALDIIHTAYVVRKGMAAPRTTELRARVKESRESMMYRRDVDRSVATVARPSWSPPVGTPATALTSADLGDAGVKGSVRRDNGVWTLQGAGGGHERGFAFAYQPLTGDGTITARVADRGANSAAVNAGLMLRRSLDAKPADFVHLRLFGNGGGQVFWRGGRGIINGNYINYPAANGTYWLRLSRRGDYVYGYSSPDGIHWSPTSNVLYSGMPATVYVGLATTSGDPATLNTATFDNVSIGGRTG